MVIHPYDARWALEFVALRALLQDALGDVAVRIDHIGSTAVPGLAAKNTIDIQVSVTNLDDPRLEPAFVALGATVTDVTTDHVPPGSVGSPGDWEKRYFRAPATWRSTHLHVREIGRPNQRYPLLFRDYLRHSAPAAAAYAQIKIALAKRDPYDVDAYYAVKDPVCDLIMEAAELWAADIGWAPGVPVSTTILRRRITGAG